MVYIYANGRIKKATLTTNRFGLRVVSLGSFWVKVRNYKDTKKGSVALVNEKGAIVIDEKPENIVVIYKGNDGDYTYDGFSFWNLQKGDRFSIGDHIYNVNEDLTITEENPESVDNNG